MPELTAYEQTLEKALRAAYFALATALDAPKLDRVQRRFIEGTKQQCADALGGAVFYDASTGQYSADPFAGLSA